MKTVTEITAEKKEASEIRLAAYCRVSSGSADQRLRGLHRAKRFLRIFLSVHKSASSF